MKLVDRTDIAGPKRDYVGYGAKLPTVVWPNKATVALNIVVNVEEGSEYSHAAGALLQMMAMASLITAALARRT